MPIVHRYIVKVVCLKLGQITYFIVVNGQNNSKMCSYIKKIHATVNDIN